MEIVRGPSAVLYGNGAMGGVINLPTDEPGLDDLSQGWTGSAQAGFASADLSPGGAARLATKARELSLLGGGSYTRFGELRAGGGDRQPLSDYDAGSWRARAVYRPTESLRVTGAYFGTRIDRAGRTDRAGQGDVRFYDNRDHFSYLSFGWRGNGAVSHIRATGSFHRTDEHADRYNCPTDPNTSTALDLAGCLTLEDRFLNRKRRYDDSVDSLGVDLDVGLNLLSQRLAIAGGAEAYWDFIGSSAEDARLSEDGTFPFVESQRGNFSDDSRYRTLGIYLHGDVTVWRINPALGEIHVLAGGRFSNFAASAPDVPGIGDVDYAYNGFSFAGGLQWLRPDLFNGYATYTQGFRAPNLQETTVLGDTGSKFEIPNDGLEPERSDTIEAGGRLRILSSELHAAYFYSLLHHAIDEAPALYNGMGTIDGKPVIKRVNAEEGHYQGVEGSARVHLWRMTLGGGIAWIEGELTDIDDQTYPARRVPPLFGLASLRYDHRDDRFFAELFSRLAARQDALHPSDEQDLRICETAPHSGVLKTDCNGTKGWYTLNLRGGVRFAGAFRINAALLNLTDRKYKLHGSGFYAPGFDARITLIAEF